jgi:hypothetical protein
MKPNRLIAAETTIAERATRRAARLAQLETIDRWSELVNILRQTVLIHIGEVQELEVPELRKRILDEEIRMGIFEEDLRAAQEQFQHYLEQPKAWLINELAERTEALRSELEILSHETLAAMWVNFINEESQTKKATEKAPREKKVWAPPTVEGTDAQWAAATVRRRVTAGGEEVIDKLFMQIAPTGWDEESIEYVKIDGRVVIRNPNDAENRIWEIRADAVAYYIREVKA